MQKLLSLVPVICPITKLVIYGHSNKVVIHGPENLVGTKVFIRIPRNLSCTKAVIHGPGNLPGTKVVMRGPGPGNLPSTKIILSGKDTEELVFNLISINSSLGMELKLGCKEE